MTKQPLPIVRLVLLFGAAVSSACATNIDADGETVGQTEQAFGEPNCINATANAGASFTGSFGDVVVNAPYSNSRCGGSWVASVSHAATGITPRANLEPSVFPAVGSGCGEWHVGLLVYRRHVLFTGATTAWEQYFLDRRYATYVPRSSFSPAFCYIDGALEAPALPPPPLGSIAQEIRVIATGRDLDGNTTAIRVAAD
jgi:hypothetical protein